MRLDTDRLDGATCGVLEMSSLSLDRFRERFPLLARRVYVNSCSQGALSTDVEAALAAYAHSWHTGGSPWDSWVEEVERLRVAMAETVGAQPDEIAVMPSASAAIAAVATALPFDGERRGVVLGEFEFPTLAHVWLAQQRRGAAVRWARASGDALPIGSYEAVVDDGTLIVPATHVCFRNGFRLDIPRLVALCRARGAYVMLDDYQHTGTAPLDVHALDVDFMVTGALKYLLGPAGVAFLYVKRALIGRLEPLVTGWFGRVNPFAFSAAPLDWAPDARRFETGTPPVPNAFAAHAGLRLLQAVGIPRVCSQVAELTARLLDGAHDRGFATLTPEQRDRRGALAVIRSGDAGELVRRLAARGVIASARGEGLRVSFHGYNTTEDVDAVLAALEANAPLVARHQLSA
ncbi:MAG: aminotransferase class V-fold PLP-dependent enzyme [Acidobacteriota bacterium]